MARTQQLVEQFNFSGGLNLTSDPIHVKDTETTDCQNVDFDTRGAVKKRLGSIQRGATDVNDDFDLLLPYRTPAGVSVLLVVSAGQATQYADTAYVRSSIASSTQSAGTLNHGVVAGGSAYVVNGTDATLKVNGVAASRLGTAAGATGNHPRAKYVSFHKNRLFFANCNAGANPSRVIFTGSDANPADLEYFKTLSTVDFDPDDGDEITAIVPFLDQLTVFKRNKIFTLRGNQPSSFIRVLANPALGCVAPRSAAAWDKGVMFLSTRGVFSFDGARATRVSEKIDPVLNDLPADTLANASGVIFQQRYYLFVNASAVGAYNETVYVFDFTTGTWTVYAGWNVRQAAIWNRVGGDEFFGIDDASRAKVMQYRIGTDDNGADIAAHFVTKWFDFGVPERRKMGRRMYVYFEAEAEQTVNIDVFKSYQTASPSQYEVLLDPLGWVWGEGVWGEARWASGWTPWPAVSPGSAPTSPSRSRCTTIPIRAGPWKAWPSSSFQGISDELSRRDPQLRERDRVRCRCGRPELLRPGQLPQHPCGPQGRDSPGS